VNVRRHPIQKRSLSCLLSKKIAKMEIYRIVVFSLLCIFVMVGLSKVKGRTEIQCVLIV
jgi:hypothetical protein